ncbi:unnamed protein product [Psylliodes chrysocephalus]|uniref:Uncharacterized protein n=1 Tax=Psylliodes chrysocephalus TaxID=3402493 RepID=A0A9P0CVI7_9CUCU|nr:unnamed protein product [Psylliodes chrysocephala]
MSAQEASYHVLSLPLSKSSRQTFFINTSPINEQAMMLKTTKELGTLVKNSTDVFMENIFAKYSNRSTTIENTCLADFVSMHSKKKLNHYNEDNQSAEYQTRQKSAIIRYRRYKLAQDPTNCYREQVLLFLPWRNEITEIENANCENIYCTNEIEI